jgi:hypothetical protein
MSLTLTDAAAADAALARRLPRSFRYMQPMQRGDDVRRLQDMLRRADPQGAGREITVIDGLFGPAMRRAVMAFQARAGLPDVDGVCGPDSWAALWMALDAGGIAARSEGAAAADRAALDAAVAQSRRENGAGGVLLRALPGLKVFHAVFDGGSRWRLTARGVEVEGRPLAGQAGGTQAAQNAFAWFGPEFRTAAIASEVPIELLVATACTEVLGNTRRYATRDAAMRAVREEPGYMSDDATPHRVSPGLMQTLISTAQQMMPELRVTRDLLFEPQHAIRAGALYIRSQAPQTRLDPPAVACAYNAGALYLQTGATNHWRMRQYPIGTPDHADRFVIFLNHIFRLVAADASLVGAAEVPSLFRMMNGG